jgi:hypothetical protein
MAWRNRRNYIFKIIQTIFQTKLDEKNYNQGTLFKEYFLFTMCLTEYL